MPEIMVNLNIYVAVFDDETPEQANRRLQKMLLNLQREERSISVGAMTIIKYSEEV